MSRTDLIFLHPSDELYGADRMLLEMVAAMPAGTSAQVWLPTDQPHVEFPLCAELNRRGITVRHLDLPIMRRAYRTPGQLVALAARVVSLTRELRAAKPGTVYCTTSAAFLAAPAARLAGVPRVLGHVQENWSGSDRRVLAPLARACHALLAISASVTASMPTALRARTTIVPNATPAPAAMSGLAGRSGPLRFLVASRWNGWKGHRTLLAAWDLLEDPGHLVVLGGPPPSGQSVDVADLVSRLRQPGSVSVIGEVNDAAPFFDEADVALIPSDDPEPFGLVAIEAFAHGRPVVASAGGGLLDIVTPGCDGWLFPAGDVQALLRLLRGLTREEVNAAGGRARATYEQRFTSAAFAANWTAAVKLDGSRSD